MFNKLLAVFAFTCVFYSLPARAEWRLIGADLAGNQWFIKDTYVHLENKEEGIDASFIIKGTRKDKPSENLAVGYWRINCKSGNIYPLEIYARNEADALIMIDSIMVSRRVLSEKLIKGVCYSLTPRIEKDRTLAI